jgi:hypothetical protein
VADHAVGAPLSANKSGSGRGTGLRQVVEGEIDLAMIPRRGASLRREAHSFFRLPLLPRLRRALIVVCPAELLSLSSLCVT